MINVIGLGFVGLTTAVGFAFKGKIVNGVEINDDKRNKLNNIVIPFHEPHLKKKLKNTKNSENLIISNKVIIDRNINYFFICVGTPSKANGSIDLTILKKAVGDVVKNIKEKKNNKKNYIIIKSTVIPGTVDVLKKQYQKYKNIIFISNPEFLREGYAWEDFIKPDKIVIGANNKLDFKKIKNLYHGFDSEFVLVTEKGAEFSKYLSNSALATMISFSNEMAIFAEKMQIKEISKIFNSFHYDKRWYGKPSQMTNYFRPGLGYGGYCLPKDVRAFIDLSKKNKIKAPILSSTNKVNSDIFDYQFDKVIKKINKKKKIFLLGLAFKPNSDDLRNSKSLKFAKRLYDLKYKNLVLCDPVCYKDLKKKFINLEIKKKPLVNKNAFYILLTAWPEYLNFIKKNKNLNIINLRY